MPDLTREQVHAAILALVENETCTGLATDAVMVLQESNRPEVLWRGETTELTTRSRTKSMLIAPPFDVPPSTRLAVVIEGEKGGSDA